MSPAPGGLGAFEAERARLNGLAYRITGSLADAEDVVQEAWVRWAAEDAAAVGNPGGWLTTVTSRLALDRLRAQRRRREVYVGPWLPDPVPTARDVEGTAELAESLTLGFLVLLDSLRSYERVAKSEAACRQLVSRARRKERTARRDERRPRPSAASAELLAQLMQSVLAGDEEKALSLLDPDVVLISDAGPDRSAARHPIVGAERVRQLLIKVGGRLFGPDTGLSRDELPPVRLVEVNSSPSLVLGMPEGPIVISGEAVGSQITSIGARLNPDKTAAFEDHHPSSETPYEATPCRGNPNGGTLRRKRSRLVRFLPAAHA